MQKCLKFCERAILRASLLWGLFSSVWLMSVSFVFEIFEDKQLDLELSSHLVGL